MPLLDSSPMSPNLIGWPEDVDGASEVYLVSFLPSSFPAPSPSTPQVGDLLRRIPTAGSTTTNCHIVTCCSFYPATNTSPPLAADRATSTTLLMPTCCTLFYGHPLSTTISLDLSPPHPLLPPSRRMTLIRKFFNVVSLCCWCRIIKECCQSWRRRA